ncbi:MAG: hypothetical protein JSW59_01215 [Phycisphaerales bacterium]|nr:MAG: hypothetical protein JSW59_01215 [Phycisphaerales bacterium]
MVSSVDVKKAKRQSHLALRRDGLSEICSGLMLGFMALFFLDFKYAGALIVGCSMQTVILPMCRRMITYPRVGYVKFRGRANVRDLIVWDVAVPLAAVGLIVCVGIWMRQLLPVCAGLLLAGLALPGARITGYALDYVLVALFLASGAAGQLLVWLGYAPGAATAIQFWSLAAVLIPAGVAELIGFLHKHGRPARETDDDES